MDENAPITYLDLEYPLSNYVNYSNVSGRYTVPVNSSQTKVYINTPSNVTNSNLVCTSHSEDLSLWGPYRVSIDYGVSDYGIGAVWRTNCTYGTQYAPYTIYDHSNYYDLCGYPKELNNTERKRREIRSNLAIIVKSRSQELRDIPNNEWVAVQTLREMITEAAYRRYLKDGFISVYGQSGKVYQIFRNRQHQKVYLKGELIEEICVRLNGDVPPTDNVIAFKTMIEVDEESFAMLGNRYNMKKAA